MGRHCRKQKMAFEIRLVKAVKLSMDAAGSRSPRYSLCQHEQQSSNSVNILFT